MTDYTINDLRSDIAETIRALRNGDEKMDVEKAKAIGDLAQTMINSAKVEVDMLRTIGRGRMTPTGFVPLAHQDTLDEQEGRPRQLESGRSRQYVRDPVGSAPRGRL